MYIVTKPYYVITSIDDTDVDENGGHLYWVEGCPYAIWDEDVIKVYKDDVITLEKHESLKATSKTKRLIEELDTVLVSNSVKSKKLVKEAVDEEQPEKPYELTYIPQADRTVLWGVVKQDGQLNVEILDWWWGEPETAPERLAELNISMDAIDIY